MPAMRAVPKTSPFLTLPLSTKSRVAGCMTMRPSATATRAVTGLAETSTMCASPRCPRWVRVLRGAMALGCRVCACGGALNQRPGRGCHVSRAHQTLSDEKRRNTHAGELRQIAGAVDAAFCNDAPVARNMRGEPLTGPQSRLECFQIAVVDANERRATRERPLQLALVMDFNKHVHPKGERRIFKIAGRRIVDRSEDDQDAIGPPGAGFDHL